MALSIVDAVPDDPEAAGPIKIAEIYAHDLTHLRARLTSDKKPPQAVDQLPTANAYQRFNSRWALRITNMVGTMTCAYVFAAIALIGLPQAIHDTFHDGVHPLSLVAWVAQTFLQLVLLSIIIVGQNIISAASDERSKATYDDAKEILQQALHIQEHLRAQDDVLTAQTAVLDNIIAGAGRRRPRATTEENPRSGP
jgi:hypothetical protein